MSLRIYSECIQPIGDRTPLSIGELGEDAGTSMAGKLSSRVGGPFQRA